MSFTFLLKKKMFWSKLETSVIFSDIYYGDSEERILHSFRHEVHIYTDILWKARFQEGCYSFTNVIAEDAVYRFRDQWGNMNPCFRKLLIM